MLDAAVRLARRIGLAAVVAALGPILPAAAYTLAPGDTVELNVVGAPELRSKGTIDVDGEIRFPLVSPIHAAGRSVDDLQAELSRQISQQAYRQRSADGHETVIAIDPGEVSVNVVDYRPVYVRGDVSRPGEQPFRPGMTVRQTVALAGGYDVLRFRMDNPVLQSSDLRADYEQLWTDLARQQARAELIRATVDGRPDPDLTGSVKAPIPTSTLADILRNETERAAVEREDYERQLAYLKAASATADTEIQAYTRPRTDAQQSEKDESDYLQRLGQLMSKGVIARSQIMDQQRSVLTSSERYLSYSMRISELTRNKAEFDRQAQHLVDDHRAQLLKDLQDTVLQVAATRTKLQSVGEKLLYTGVISSQLTRGTGSKPEIRIVHSGQNTAAQLASEDTVLQAGDVVDVSLRAELLPQGLGN